MPLCQQFPSLSFPTTTQAVSSFEDLSNIFYAFEGCCSAGHLEGVWDLWRLLSLTARNSNVQSFLEDCAWKAAEGGHLHILSYLRTAANVQLTIDVTKLSGIERLADMTASQFHFPSPVLKWADSPNTTLDRLMEIGWTLNEQTLSQTDARRVMRCLGGLDGRVIREIVKSVINFHIAASIKCLMTSGGEASLVTPLEEWGREFLSPLHGDSYHAVSQELHVRPGILRALTCAIRGASGQGQGEIAALTNQLRADAET
uniref:Uncharacterized protein n=1 Tax=Chromera velia CCMP2878 TaxID=1169474 RepID=A0A0G4FMB3_9ALVE|eukprot:Cvel_17679.t1-p1 / transcript=Cvel_17679.t1 / gene=Cvel_17679 / organism=Chromera_velia_CCMP2878 / gene_product=hypothetical protein / transcript_product=hypothetical protein / location=Cvel_scaffold1425:43135-43905(+) / protein_length=257 / sequence_SO=supercontig / SO=protein_coding / is_pseudo=false